VLPPRIGDAEDRIRGGRGSWVRRPAVAWAALALTWWALALLGVGALQDAGRSLADAAYGTLQLTVLEGGGDTGGSTRLQVARFLAPVALAATLLQAARSIRGRSRHDPTGPGRTGTVVCGGGATSADLVRALAARGERVAVVDLDPHAPAMTLARALGATTVVGDATDPLLLARADVASARRLVAATGDPAVDVRIACAAGSVERHPAAGPLRRTVLLDDPAVPAPPGCADVDWFDVHDRGARELLTTLDDPHGPAAVVGLGPLGRALVLALAQQAAFAQPGRPLPLALVDPAATRRWEGMCLRHPRLRAACEVHLHDVDLAAPEPAALERLQRHLAQDPPRWVAVTDRRDGAPAAALVLDLAPAASVVVATGTAPTAGEAAEAAPGRRVRTFPVAERTWTLEALDGGSHQRLATALAVPGAPMPASAAGEVLASLEAVGLVLAPSRRWGDAVDCPSSDDLERLALREHLRWCRRLRADGWVEGDERDEGARREPWLARWPELPREARDAARERIRALAEVLSLVGLELRPRPGRSAARRAPTARPVAAVIEELPARR